MTATASSDASMVVRIGIVTMNRPEDLRKCLASCVSQTYKPKEIVVCDNSTDVQARRMNVEVAAEFPDVRIDGGEAGRSLIEARAAMMAEPGYDLFCCVDDDAWFSGCDEIARAVGEFIKTSALAGIAFDILSPDRPEPVERQPGRPAMSFVGCGHMLRREMVLAAGNYADLPGPYGSEERDLCLRFLDRGWEVRFLPGVHVWHDKSSVGRDWGRQHRSGTLNDLMFGFLRAPMPDVLYYLPGKAFNLVRWGWKGRKEERWAGLLGVVDFVRCLPRYIQKRSPVSCRTFRAFFESGRRSAEKPRDWEGNER
ncbi:MAG: glycosyltransferase family 2 protein [Chthoniobacterales bacterium]|nr:glycosyltransferase family 2 protein [Chthoniobacterales bacterium]